MADNPRDVLRQEARAVGELAALHGDPVFYGRGVPRGDGRLVVVVPGLFGNDAYLYPLRMWLTRIGYRPVMSRLWMNAGCPQRLRTTVADGLARQRERRPGPVALIGHSRGGMLCWALAAQLGADVSHLVLLGSPAPAVVAMTRAGGDYASSSVARRHVADAGRRALKLLDPDCNVPECGCPYPEDLRRGLDPATRVLAVASRDDPIVRPDACRVGDLGVDVEVGGTHGGLVQNREVYPHVARFLASG